MRSGGAIRLVKSGHAVSDLQTDLETPIVPAAYAAAWVTLLEGRGVPRDKTLEGVSFEAALLSNPTGRVKPIDFTRLVLNGFAATGDPALGFELGLALKPTTHGFLGYALLTCGTLREAIRLGERYIRLRIRPVHVKLSAHGPTATLTIAENEELGEERRFLLEALAGGLVRIGEFLLGPELGIRDAELWLDLAEPPYYASVRDRLPPIRFDAPTNELRFPAEWLDRPLALADPAASQAAVQQLERELALFGEDDDIVVRVRALLEDATADFPDLEAAASRLHVSSRTLKRRLARRGTTYQHLLDQTRKARATALLRDTRVPIAQIAATLGYRDPANFTRAFRKWTGRSPSEFRGE